MGAIGKLSDWAEQRWSWGLLFASALILGVSCTVLSIWHGSSAMRYVYLPTYSSVWRDVRSTHPAT